MHKRVLNNTDKTNAAPTDDTTHFGQYLKDERLKQGLSLEDVSRQTGINLNHLLALEEGDRRKLPADVFNRGFIRLYAETLRIDPKSPLDNYEKEWGFSNGMRGAKTFLSGDHLFETTSPFADRQVLTFIGIVILVASVFLAYMIFLPKYGITPLLKGVFQPTISQKVISEPPEDNIISPTETSASDKQQDDIQSEKETVPLPTRQISSVETSLPAPVALQKDQEEIDHRSIIAVEERLAPLEIIANTKDQALTDNETSLVGGDEPSASDISAIIENELMVAKPEETTSPEINSAPSTISLPEEELEKQYVLQAHFTERTWLRITLDESNPAEYTFKPEESHTWNAETKIKLFLGNAGGVKLSLNGAPITLDKGSGQTLKISFP